MEPGQPAAENFIDAGGTVAEAFLHHEFRLVDQGGCIQFRGKRYETRTSLIGQKVGIAYDPADPTTIIVSHSHMPSFTAQPLRIGSYCSQAPVLPALQCSRWKPETSRLLDGLEERHKQSGSL